MLDVNVAGDIVRIGERFAVAFHRTLRIPEDGRTYPLPPGLGRLPVHRVAEVADRAPATWRDRDGIFIALHQREALWLGFDAASWKPNAVKVGVGGINAVTGDPWDERLHADPQDYLVCPPQLWLDGINTGTGIVRQFVAMPLGLGYTVEEQISGAGEVGGIQIVVFEPMPGRFPDRPPEQVRGAPAALAALAPMGLGAGGEIRQKLYPDPHGLDTWDPDNHGSVSIHIVNSEQYQVLTGEHLPPPPIDAATYTAHGLPWFDLYDEDMPDLPAATTLARVQPIHERDAELGEPPGADDAAVEVTEGQIRRFHPHESET